ncbi:T9SS type A sorting domain-containing protein [candidate division KSB1 bacterium]|nr:T9SS type A sorting domain-containing protein [candidate division KSB1 bacterium]
MTRRLAFFGVLIGLGASFADAQWQAVPSPADRVFTFVQSGNRIFAGSEDSGLWLSTNAGASFAVYPTGLPEMNFDIRSFEVRQDTLWVGIAGGGVCRSTDGGTTWSVFNDGFETQSFVVGVKQIGDTVYAAVDWAIGLQPSGVYKSSVKQANWRRAGTGFPAALAGVTSFVATKSGALLVGAALAGLRGNVQVSLDNGNTWSNRGIPSVGDVYTLEAEGDTVYAGTSNGLYVTKDFGANWQRLGTQFQNTVVDDIFIFNRRLFAAVDGVGVVFSTDGGATWNVITGNLPIDNDFVSALFIHGGKIFAALSAAHGVWNAPLPASSVDEDNDVPRAATLEQNYPNPFNPSTSISFALPKTEYVTLKVYNVLGKEVATILYHEKRAAGRNLVLFTAPKLASGVYFYRLTAGSFTLTKKMLLVR